MNDEVNETAEDEANPIKDAFDAAVSEGKTDDETKMAMIAAGAIFKSVTRIYNQFMIDEGFAVSKEEKADILQKALEGKDLTEEAGFGKAVAAIIKKAAGVTEKSAATSIRAWAKAQDPVVEVYAKPKGESIARVGFRSRFYDALVANPQMTEAECKAYLENDEDSSPNKMKHMSNFQGMRNLANRIHALKAA